MKRERVINSFIDMVKIYSPSLNEKEYSEYLVKQLERLGLEVYLDLGFKKYGGNAPTIFAKLKGNVSGEGVTLAAHMDVVEPCANINPIVDGDFIKTDETTTLGGDDKAGIAAILEVLENLIESEAKHEDVFVLLTPCEENGMLGAKNIDWDLVPTHMIPAKNMIVIDNSGRAGLIAHTAPSKYDFKITFKGRKAHAGIEPEKGINAIVVASKAISNMHIGRIDEVTTSNIGKIEGGGATNIVTDEVCFTAEIRSHVNERLIEEIEHMKTCCEGAAKSMNATCKFENENAYPSFELSKDSYIFKLTEGATKKAGVEPIPMIIGGGSDANIMANLGYQSAIISIGMYNVHTVNEYLNIDELFAASKIVYNMMAL